MTLSIRNSEADALARRLAEIEGPTITDAVVIALKEAIMARVRGETPSETARRILAKRILAKRGLALRRDREPIREEACHELDHDLTGAT